MHLRQQMHCSKQYLGNCEFALAVAAGMSSRSLCCCRHTKNQVRPANRHLTPAANVYNWMLELASVLGMIWQLNHQIPEQPLGRLVWSLACQRPPAKAEISHAETWIHKFLKCKQLLFIGWWYYARVLLTQSALIHKSMYLPLTGRVFPR